MNTYFLDTLVKEAKKRGFALSVINPEEPAVVFKTGRRSIFFSGNACNLIGAATHSFINSRSLTGDFLKKYGFPIAKWIKVSSKEDAINFLKKVKSVIVKPNSLHLARGISAAICENNELLGAIKRASLLDKEVVISEYITGKEFKAIVIGQKLIMVLEKVAPYITGDGKKKIRKLIDEFNLKLGKNGNSARVPVDVETWRTLKLQKVDYDTVLKENKTVKLRMFASHHCGATLKDITNAFDAPILAHIKKIAKLLETELLALDFVMADSKKLATIVDLSTDIALPAPFAQRISEALLDYIECSKK